MPFIFLGFFLGIITTVCVYDAMFAILRTRRKGQING
jgi:hypothetical protein